MTTYQDLTLQEEPLMETLHDVLISLGRQQQYSEEASIQNVQYFSHFLELQLQGKLRDQAHCQPSKTLI